MMLLSTTLDVKAAMDWSSVLVVSELKQGRQEGLEVDTIVQLANFARLMFATQHSRRFMYAFTICDEYMRYWIFHCHGLMDGDEFSINNNPQLFLSVILAYAVMNDHDLGFDTTLLFTEEGMVIGQLQDRIRLYLNCKQGHHVVECDSSPRSHRAICLEGQRAKCSSRPGG